MSRWTTDEVLEHLRRRAAGGASLGSKDVRREDRALSEAARRYFAGGWQQALEEAADRWPALRRLREAADAHHVGELAPRGEGAKLRAARVGAGLSQRQLGETTGDGQAQISNWERGRGSIPARVWQALGLEAAPDGPAPALSAAPIGRPPAPARPRKVQVVLSEAAWERWLSWPSGERSARVTALIEADDEDGP